MTTYGKLNIGSNALFRVLRAEAHALFFDAHFHAGPGAPPTVQLSPLILHGNPADVYTVPGLTVS